MTHINLYMRGFLVALMFAIPVPASAQDADLAVMNATLIDGTGKAPQKKVTILVRDGLITSVGSTEKTIIPKSAHVIDATGKFVIPGLADMHVHFGSGGLIPADSFSAGRAMRQFLFYGVTSIFNVGAEGGGMEDILLFQEEDRVTWPHLYATGGLITIPGSHPIATILRPPNDQPDSTYDWGHHGVWVVRTAEDIRRVVKSLASDGMNGIKIVVESGPTVYGDHHPQMSPELIEAAVNEANRQGIRVFAHATSIDELQVAVAHHVHGIMHLVCDPEPPGTALLKTMAAQNMYYVPTLSLYIWTGTWGDPSQVLTDPFLKRGVEARVINSLVHSALAPTSPPSEKDRQWRRGVLRALKSAHDAGVTIVGGSDTGNPFVFPGYSMHEELQLMVEAGLTPMEALVASTRRAAEMIGKEKIFGTVEPGKRADLVILRNDPLVDIRNTRTLDVVIRAGEIVDLGLLLTDE